MYVDSVYIKHFQEVAQLISPVTTAPMSGCLSFYYQLQQGNDNVFSLYSRDVTGLYEEIWKTNSPGNPAWNLAEVEFSAPYPMEVGVPMGPDRATMQVLPTQKWRYGGATVSHSFFSAISQSFFSLPFLGPLHFSLFFVFPSAFLLYRLHFLI